MFEELRTFVEVAESKNFTRTAQKLNFSQPAISQQVKKVEIFFGNTTLLTRSAATKHIELTEAGEAAYRFAKQVLALMDAAFEEIGRIRRHTAARSLRVGASMTIGDYMLPKVLKAYCERFPDVQTEIFIGNTRQICDALKEDAVDLGLIEGRNIAHNFRRVDFFTDHLVLAASPEVAAGIREFSAKQLGGLLWITREQGSGTEQYIDSFLNSNHIRTARRIVYNSNFAIKEVVKEGLGVTFMSRLVMRDELLSGKLVRLPVNKSYTREFSYILPEDSLPDSAAQAFLDTLLEVSASFQD